MKIIERAGPYFTIDAAGEKYRYEIRHRDGRTIFRVRSIEEARNLLMRLAVVHSLKVETL